jgi:hypothetical protein
MMFISPFTSLDYDTILRALRLLSGAAYELKLQGDPDDLEGADGFVEESKEVCLRLIDGLRYDDIVGDGQLTGPAMNTAMLEGWCMIQAKDGSLHIEQDDASEDFADAAAAYAFVAARAESKAPGSKLHQIAIKLAE